MLSVTEIYKIKNKYPLLLTYLKSLANQLNLGPQEVLLTVDIEENCMISLPDTVAASEFPDPSFTCQRNNGRLMISTIPARVLNKRSEAASISALVKLKKPRYAASSLPESYRHTYNELFTSTLATKTQQEKDILIAKLSHYAVIEYFSSIPEKNISISYIGRRRSKILPQHEALFMPGVIEGLDTNGKISVFHLALIEGPDQNRILMDLGSTNGTEIIFKEGSQSEDYTKNTTTWLHSLIKQLEQILNDPTHIPKYEKVCPSYLEVKDEVVKYMQKTRENCNVNDQKITLKSTKAKMSWLPVPPGSICQINLADSSFTLGETLPTEEQAAIASPEI